MSNFTSCTKINKTPKVFPSNNKVLIQIILGKNLQILASNQIFLKNILLTELLFCEWLGLVGEELIVQDLDSKRQCDGIFLISAKHVAFQNAYTLLLVLVVHVFKWHSPRHKRN